MSSTDYSDGDVFGQIITAPQLEKAAIELMRNWLPTYIAELSLQVGWSGHPIPAPRSYSTRNSARDHYAEDQLPEMIVVSPGLAGAPVKSGSGVYRVTWALGVGIIASAQDEETTKYLAKFYAACIRAIMLQHRSIGGIASNLEWTDESYDDIDDSPDLGRVLASGFCTFKVEVENVVTWTKGPRIPLAPIPSGTEGDLDAGRYPSPDPATQPGSVDPTAATVNVTLTKEPL